MEQSVHTVLVGRLKVSHAGSGPRDSAALLLIIDLYPVRVLPLRIGLDAEAGAQGAQSMQCIGECALFLGAGLLTQQFAFPEDHQLFGTLDALSNSLAVRFKKGIHVGVIPRLRPV